MPLNDAAAAKKTMTKKKTKKTKKRVSYTNSLEASNVCPDFCLRAFRCRHWDCYAHNLDVIFIT